MDRRFVPSVKLNLAIQLLGGFLVSTSEVNLNETAWHSRRARNLVKLLALAPGHRLHRDQVMDALWPDSDLAAAANNFHQTLFAARKVLEAALPGCLTLEEGFLSLGSDDRVGIRVDVEAFEAAASQARCAQAPALFQAALELYKGDLLPDDPYAEWALQRRESLRKTYLGLLFDLALLYEKRGDAQNAIDVLQRLLALDPCHEDAHIAIMRLYAGSGKRQEALLQYNNLRENLRHDLEVDPCEDATRLYQAIQSGGFSPLSPHSPTNLPAQLTSFIGREKQIQEVCELVRGHRLVTLTGAGGTGKTRLALRAADDLLEDFKDGVFLVELAPLSDPELVPAACVHALQLIIQPGGNTLDMLTHYLEKKNLLLILDNCEHVISTCARLVTHLLSSCPRLIILATSREILSAPGEYAYRVPSLEVIDPEALDPGALDPGALDPGALDPRSLHPLAEIAKVESVRLFMERAGQVAPSLTLTETNAVTIATIGQRLDGIPLAIELAAARARLLTTEQIAARLDRVFNLLTGGSRAALPRHQTLKAMVDWSYDLLSGQERFLLMRLSVFAGGWDLEAAEAVCSDYFIEGSQDSEFIGLLAQLVDKSLVQVETRGKRARYDMLEIIKQYARDRLMDEGLIQSTGDRHLDYFARLTGEAESHLLGHGQVEWLDRLEGELDNLRAALDWSLTGRVELGIKMMADSMWMWWIRSHFVEGTEWLRKLMEAAGPDYEKMGMKQALQYARGLRTYIYLSMNIYVLPQEKRVHLLEKSVDILRGLGLDVRRELGISLYNLWRESQSPDQPSPYIMDMLKVLQEEKEETYYGIYLFDHSLYMLITQDDFLLAKTLMTESLELCQKNGDIDGISARLGVLSFFSRLEGDYAKSESLIKEAIELTRKVNNRWWGVMAEQELGYVWLTMGRHEEATRIGDTCLKIYRDMAFAFGISNNLYFLQETTWSAGAYAESIRMGEEIIEAQAGGTVSFVFMAHIFLGRALISTGDLPAAETTFRKACLKIDPLISKEGKSYLLQSWAVLFARQGKFTQAARALGAADSSYRYYGLSYNPRTRSEHEETLEAARAGLGETDFRVAWLDGEAMTPDQALAEIKKDTTESSIP